MVENDDQADDAEDEEENDEKVTQFDDHTRNIDGEYGVIETGECGESFVEDRWEMIEYTKACWKGFANLLVYDDKRDDHGDVHQKIEQDTETLETTREEQWRIRFEYFHGTVSARRRRTHHE